MSKSEWLSLDEITIVQPTGPGGVEALADDLREVRSELPGANPVDDAIFIDWLKECPEAVTLAYHGDQIIGYVDLRSADQDEEVGKHSLEFGGVVLEAYRHQGITQQVAPAVIAKALLRTGKRKVLARIQAENKEGRMALAALGFRHFGKDEDGYLFYKLTRENALSFVK